MAENRKVHSRKKVLLVDDEPTFTRMLRMNLEATGAYEVKEENNSAQAVATALEFKPDVVLLDLIMPEVDGGTIASQIRSSRELGGAKIIFLTAVVGRREANGSWATLRAIPCIAKPVATPELIACIERHTGRGKEGR